MNCIYEATKLFKWLKVNTTKSLLIIASTATV